MLELPITVRRRPFQLDSHIRRCFPSRIAFCLVHTERTIRKTLFCIVIADFERGEFFDLDLGSAENQSRLESYAGRFHLADHSTPHSFLEVERNKRLLVFVSESRFFCDIDLENGMCRFLTEEDFPELLGGQELAQFGMTLYEEIEAPGYFYFPILTRNGALYRYSLYYARTDLSSFEPITAYDVDHELMPHVTRHYKDVVFNSPFSSSATFTDIRTGKLRFALTPSVLRDFFGDACVSDSAFREFYVQRYGDFEELCLQNGITLADEGYVESISLKTKGRSIYRATGPNTAHLEIDDRTDAVYTSNHNFTSLPEWTFFGPGTLDKFQYSDGALAREASFSHPTAFRLTNHRVFYFEGRPYVATIGHPNRLFFIDAASMQLIYFADVGEPVIPHAPDLKKYLNRCFRASCLHALVPLEAGDNGMMFLMGPQHIYFYDFGARRLAGRIAYKPSDSYYLYSVHSQYL
jgi:hypothetical protein